MKVLHVINSLILAGVEVLIREMVPRQRQNGLDVSVAVLKELDSPLERDLRASGTPFVKLPAYGFYDPRFAFALQEVVGNYDVIQANLFPSQLWVAMARERSGRNVPLVTTEQSTHNRRRRRVLKPLDAWMYDRYAAVACNSEGTAQEFVRWLPSMRARTSVVPNGVPVEKFANAHPSEELKQLTAGQPTVIFVARFESAKDHPTLLRAIAQVNGIHVVLVGDGPLRPQMEALAVDLGIRERAHFLGRRSDIPSLLKASDVYVHSSNWEGFGIAAVEAMSAGLPVIASDVPGLSEVVGGAGVCFPAGDAQRLAEEIKSVLQDAQRRERMIAGSRQRAQEYSIEATVASYIKIYEEAIAANGSGARAVRQSRSHL